MPFPMMEEQESLNFKEFHCHYFLYKNKKGGVTKTNVNLQSNSSISS